MVEEVVCRWLRVMAVDSLDELRCRENKEEAVIQRGYSDMGPVGVGLYTTAVLPIAYPARL